jgi:hypothetical protein
VQLSSFAFIPTAPSHRRRRRATTLGICTDRRHSHISQLLERIYCNRNPGESARLWPEPALYPPIAYVVVLRPSRPIWQIAILLLSNTAALHTSARHSTITLTFARLRLLSFGVAAAL